MKHLFAGLMFSCLALMACSSSSPSGSTAADGGSNAGADAGSGAGTDAGTGASADAGSGASADAGSGASAGVQPPSATPGAQPGDGTGSVTFAISKLYLGDTDPDGTPDRANGWRSYGYDLDGKVSTASSTGLCQPANGASPNNVYPDGDDGIDNSFGKLILPIVLGLTSDASQKINSQLASGQFTILLDVQQLGTGSDYAPLMTNLFNGANLMAMPKFDGTDMWPVLPDLLNDGATIASGSKVSFPASYLTHNTWVSGTKGSVTLNLPGMFPLPITNAIITFELDATHQHATKGVIAGVMNAAQLATGARNTFGAIDSSLCSGPTSDSIISQIEQASDIMHDGTQDPTKPCDAISIGLGFDAEVVQLGAVAPAAMPPANPCMGN